MTLQTETEIIIALLRDTRLRETEPFAGQRVLYVPLEDDLFVEEHCVGIVEVVDDGADAGLFVEIKWSSRKERSLHHLSGVGGRFIAIDLEPERS